MDLKNWFRSSLILLVLMVALLFIVTFLAGANIGPVELILWLAILTVGILLCGLGSRRRAR